MTPRDFCYWLQGFVEMAQNKHMTGPQFQVMSDHLALVFEKKTPTYSCGENQVHESLIEIPEIDIEEERRKLNEEIKKNPPNFINKSVAIMPPDQGFDTRLEGTYNEDGTRIQDKVLREATLTRNQLDVPYSCGTQLNPEFRDNNFTQPPPDDPIQSWLDDPDAPVSC